MYHRASQLDYHHQHPGEGSWETSGSGGETLRGDIDYHTSAKNVVDHGYGYGVGFPEPWSEKALPPTPFSGPPHVSPIPGLPVSAPDTPATKEVLFNEKKLRYSPRRFVSFAASFCLFAAFILYLLVGLSSPIIKSIYLFTINLDLPTQLITAGFQFGVWGYCSSNSAVAVVETLTGNAQCTPAHLGYTIPDFIIVLTGNPSLTNTILQWITVLLIIHIVCAAMALVCMVISFFGASQRMTVLALIVSLLTLVLGSVALAADLALVIVARDRVQFVEDGVVDVGWGNGVWMVTAATALTWFSFFLLCAVACRCCGIRNHKEYRQYSV